MLGIFHAFTSTLARMLYIYFWATILDLGGLSPAGITFFCSWCHRDIHGTLAEHRIPCNGYNNKILKWYGSFMYDADKNLTKY